MQRLIEMEGAVNFRDFGGYATREGGRVRTGLLFRSGRLDELTDNDRARLHALGIDVVCDLRHQHERDREPSALHPEGPEQVHIPMDPGSAIALRAALTENTATVEDRINFMIGINRELVLDHAEDYRRMFEVLLGTRNGGFLVHCSAGKDRTGFAAAIIKLALGVSRTDVESDYLFTNEVLDFENVILPRLQARYGHEAPTLEEARAISGVRLEYLHAALDAVVESYGSIDTYLRDAMRLGEPEMGELTGRYVER